MKKWILVAGARPNFMKIAPLVRAIDALPTKIDRKIVHTGQHYDFNMAQVFFEDLEIPQPHYFLEVGSGSHAQQIGMTMIKFEDVCEEEKPDLVIVVGDVNATLACALAARKLNIPIAHVEAGLRSFDMTMPEEINRILTDRISDFCFCTEASGVANLMTERNWDGQWVSKPGDVMIDSLKWQLEKLDEAAEERLGQYCLLTMHRPSNVDDPNRLARLVKVINEVSDVIQVIFPQHPRVKAKLQALATPLDRRIVILGPVGYREMVSLLRDATVVITDSGGMQIEASYLKRPCLTLRNTTEQKVTLEVTNMLVGDDLDLIVPIVEDLVVGIPMEERVRKNESTDMIWGGHASERIVKILEREL